MAQTPQTTDLHVIAFQTDGQSPVGLFRPTFGEGNIVYESFDPDVVRSREWLTAEADAARLGILALPLVAEKDAIVVCVSKEHHTVLHPLHPTFVEGIETCAVAVSLKQSHHALWMTLLRTTPNRSEHVMLRKELCAMMVAGYAVRECLPKDLKAFLSTLKNTLLDGSKDSVAEVWKLARTFAFRFDKTLPIEPPLPT